MTDHDNGSYDDDHYGEQKKKAGRTHDGERERDQFDAASIKEGLKDISKDAEKALYKAGPMFINFITSLWNGLMRVFDAVKLMPLLRKSPWILVAIFVLFGLWIPVISPLLAAMGTLALARGAKASNDFVISTNARKDDFEGEDDDSVDISVSF